MRGAKTLQGFQPWSVEGHGLVGVWIVLIGVSTALVMGVVALCVWRKRLAMLWSLTGPCNHGLHSYSTVGPILSR